jgi:hypothetical protein
MNSLSEPPQPSEPDMALLYLGSLFETLDYTLPPERDEASSMRLRGAARPPVSLVGRLRKAPALRSGCSCRDRVCDAAVIPDL